MGDVLDKLRLCPLACFAQPWEGGAGGEHFDFVCFCPFVLVGMPARIFAYPVHCMMESSRTLEMALEMA